MSAWPQEADGALRRHRWRPERSRRHDVELFALRGVPRKVFGTAFEDGDSILDPQLLHSPAEYCASTLLAVEQYELGLREDDGHHETWYSSTTPEIQDSIRSRVCIEDRSAVPECMVDVRFDRPRTEQAVLGRPL